MNLLSITIFTPLIAALGILLFRSKVHSISYVSVGATIVSSLLMLISFDRNTHDFQFIQEYPLIKWVGLDFFIGIDGISLLLIALTSLLIFLCIIYSLKTVKTNLCEFIICTLVLQFCINGSFASLNLMLFYIFFEFSLVPMYIMILIWGGENRVFASYKFFIYTLFGSFMFLASLMFIFAHAESLNIPDLYDIEIHFSSEARSLLWAGLFIGFAIKIPMFFFHTWLPDAHVQAPTTASVLLAGILLKFGAYGFLRILLPLMPYTTKHFAFIPLTLSVIAIIYASFVAMAQEDMKKMIAYSSVAHMGYVTLGIFSLNHLGILGAIVQMISHGLISGGLFFVIGMLYERMHTKRIENYGGVLKFMPSLGAYFLFLTLGSIGLPGTSGFIGEFLTLNGAFKVSVVLTMLSCFGVLLSAIYGLNLYKNIMLGPVKNRGILKICDISLYEKIILMFLGALILIMGIYPNIITQFLELSIINLEAIQRL